MNTELTTTGRRIDVPTPAPPLPSGPVNSSGELQLGDIWRVLLKRRIVIAASIILTLAAALVYSLIRTPQYDSISRIAINFDNQSVFGADNPFAALTGSDLQTKLETQVRILSSDILASTVIRQLHLDTNPQFAGKMAGKIPADNRGQRTLLGMFRSGLTVTVLPKTELIEIRYRSRSPELSASIVNNLVNAYVERNFKVKYESTMQVSDWLQKQLDEIKQHVEQTQEKLAGFQRDHGVLFFSGKTGSDEGNSTVAKLDELNRQLMAAQSERIMKEAIWRMAQSNDAELIAATVPGGTLQILQAQRADLRNQYAQATAKYGDAYPKVAQLKAQLAQVESSIHREVQNTSERLRNEYSTSKNAEQMLSAEVDKQKKEAYKLNEAAVQYTIMRRDFESSRELYDGLLRKLKEAGITAGLHSTNVTIVDPAAVAADPSEPNLPRNLSLGLAGGLLLGIMGAFVLENMDNTLRNVEEVEAYTGLPSLGLIPLIKANGNGHRRMSKSEQKIQTNDVDIIALSRPKSQISESFRSLRSSVLLSSIDRPLKTMVVTSALPREGKSTTTINSAIVLAQKGARVLLVDADMRRPRLHGTFNLPNTTGLSTVTAGTNTFEEAVVPCPQLENLHLLVAGPSAPYPAELLGSRRMSEMLAKWREQYDYIILDTPPVLTVTDAVVLAAQADSTIIVLRWGYTGYQALRRSRDLLQRAHARIAGVVVNAVNFDSPEHYYYYGGRYGYYGYRYGYRYGYGYGDSHEYYDNEGSSAKGHNGNNGHNGHNGNNGNGGHNAN